MRDQRVAREQVVERFTLQFASAPVQHKVALTLVEEPLAFLVNHPAVLATLTPILESARADALVLSDGLTKSKPVQLSTCKLLCQRGIKSILDHSVVIFELADLVVNNKKVFLVLRAKLHVRHRIAYGPLLLLHIPIVVHLERADIFAIEAFERKQRHIVQASVEHDVP